MKQLVIDIRFTKKGFKWHWPKKDVSEDSVFYRFGPLTIMVR